MSKKPKLLLLAMLLAGCGSLAEKPAPEEQKSDPQAVPAAPILPPKDTAAAPAPDPAPAAASSRDDLASAIAQEHRDASNAYYEALQKALGDSTDPTPEQWIEAQKQVKEPDWKSYTARAQKLLDEDPTDLAAFRTIQWMLDNARDPETRPALLELLEKHHFERPEMGPLCARLAQDGGGLVAKLAESSPHRDVRGMACMALAEGIKNDIEYAGYAKDAKPDELEGIKGWLGAEKFDALLKLDHEQAAKDLEQAYERVTRDYGDVLVNKGSKREATLGKRAGAALYEMHNLVVGKPAPEIEGVDLDQVAFKLSDYKGKVVLLDFWGNW